MKKKWLLIAIALLAIGGVIGYFASRAGNNATPITTNPVPIQTPIQTPAQTAPAVTNEPAPAGVIEITAEKLIKDLLASPNKYKKGDVLQVSGTITKGFLVGWTHLYYYSPRGADNPSPDYSFAVTLNGSWDHSKTTEGAKVTVLGTFTQWARFPEGGGRALIEVIEVIPAK